jgi:tetratricopeptide (TPR) repeat protein
VVGCVATDRVNKSAWRIKGDVLSKAGEALTAVKTAYEFAVGDWNEECDDVTLLLKLAAVYIGLVCACALALCFPSFRVAHRCTVLCYQRDESLYGSAKEIALRAAKVSDWSIAWLLAGQAAYLAGQMDQAEAALNQANISYASCACLCSVSCFHFTRVLSETTRMRKCGRGWP